MLYSNIVPSNVSPFGLSIKEDSIDYNDFNIASYENVIGDYGLEKIKSEYFIYQSDCHYIFPRLPTVIGVNDPKQRMQQFVKKLTVNPIELPTSNPSFNILGEYDAAKALYDLSFLAFKGAVNLASEETLSPRQLVSYFEPLLSRRPVINWVNNYPFIFSDIIKNDSKTLCLAQQQALQIKLSATNDVLKHFTSFAIAQVTS